VVKVVLIWVLVDLEDMYRQVVVVVKVVLI
jgi:hypothetical protein